MCQIFQFCSENYYLEAMQKNTLKKSNNQVSKYYRKTKDLKVNENFNSFVSTVS